LRVLEPDIIIKTALLLSLLFALFAVNMYFFIRQRLSKFAGLLHVASLFGFLGIFCYMMDLVILDLPFDNYYRQTGTASLIICLLVSAIPIFTLLFMRDKAYLRFRVMPDLKTVFTSIDDLAIIVDYNGVITEINHPERLNDMLGDKCQTIAELMEKLRHKSPDNNHAILEIGQLNMNGKEKFEIYFSEENSCHIFSWAPVVAGKSRLGTTIVMHDITEKKKSEQQIKNHNTYLEDANLKLSNYVNIANVLETEKERLKLLEQVQMELIFKIEKAIDHVHHIQKNTYDDILDYQKDIAQVADMMRDVYKDVRISIRRISGEERR